MRTYDDEVDVRGEPAPRQFLWRGRLYVVRDVLSHWYERTAWWDGAAARATRGDGEAPVVPERAGAERVGAEREVWRVEASAGRSAGSGVFDLALTGSGPGSWRLLRAVD